MADNIAITAGSGTTIATDNIGGTNYQRVKIDNGADGVSGGDVCSTNPLPVNQTPFVHLTAAPTVTAGSYTTGQVVGGLISLSGAARVNTGSGIIQTVSVTVKTALTAPFDVLFFDTNPTNGTYTDNQAIALGTDGQFLCGVAHCTDLISGGTPQILQAANLALPFSLSAAATTLYAVIVMRGGETLASTSAIGLNVLIMQN